MTIRLKSVKMGNWELFKAAEKIPSHIFSSLISWLWWCSFLLIYILQLRSSFLFNQAWLKLIQTSKFILNFILFDFPLSSKTFLCYMCHTLNSIRNYFIKRRSINFIELFDEQQSDDCWQCYLHCSILFHQF